MRNGRPRARLLCVQQACACVLCHAATRPCAWNNPLFRARRPPPQNCALHEALPVLLRLACHPLYTLHVGSCFRPCLLPLASSLVEHLVQQQQEGGAGGSPSAHRDFSVALLKLLELAPHISRWGRA